MVSNNSDFSHEEEAVLKTLLYSDIFHFPLTREEIWRFLISDKKLTKKACNDALASLSGMITAQGGYYCLKGQEETIVKRQENLLQVHHKQRIAKQAAFLLSHIPTVLFIGISGGLAVGNASHDDDIDFFVITRKGTLFMTRLWILALLEWKRLRRKRTDKYAANKICVNLLLDESRLAFPSRKHDLYIAHEVVQVQPVFERGDTYQLFIENNNWVKKFLPNSQEEKSIFHGVHWKTDYQIVHLLSKLVFVPFFERLVQRVQQGYMRKHQTIEQVTNSILAFHPNDYRLKTLEDLRSKCEKLGLLTKF